jgi:hypothetical protein
MMAHGHKSHLDIWPPSCMLMCLRLNINVHSHRGAWQTPKGGLFGMAQKEV